jgi:transcriptional regulator with XRE-family HTH domain
MSQRTDAGSGVGTRNGSVVRRRMLGRQLRLLRERAGLTLDEAAPRLDWSASKLSRIENGQQSVDVHGVRSMLDLYGAGGDQWTDLITLTREARQSQWWQAYGSGDPSSYVAFESEAAVVLDFTLDYVPGLLQTADYTRALFASSVVPRSDERLATEVAVRMVRQERLTSAEHPVELVAIVDESVLHRAIGGPDVLRAQLDHLIDRSQLPSVTLQVLPMASPCRAINASGFTVLHYGDLDEPDIAYVEHAFGSVRLEKDADVTRARLAFDRLRSDALCPADSEALIRKVAGRG